MESQRRGRSRPPQRGRRRPARRADAVVGALLERITSGDLVPGQLVPNETVAVRDLRRQPHGGPRGRQEPGVARPGDRPPGHRHHRLPAGDLEPAGAHGPGRRGPARRAVPRARPARRGAHGAGVAAGGGRGPGGRARTTWPTWGRCSTGSTSLVDDPEQMDDADVAFHERIMLASGNQLARAIVRTVHAEARRSERYSGHVDAVDRRETNRQHHGDPRRHRRARPRGRRPRRWPPTSPAAGRAGVRVQDR